ncbi:MAG: N-acetylmuramoyl-L-alanine amidase [Desulfonatronovibrio sp.]
MIKKTVQLILIVFFMAAGVPNLVMSSDYQKGIGQFNSLVKDQNRAQYRSHWLDIADMFEQSYEADPKGPNAVKSLFYLGRTYEELGKRSYLESDFEKAENYYDQVVRDFPSHSWADDAQFRKAGIYLNEHEDSAQAYIEYLRVVYNFPKGDKRAEAKEILKELDQANLEKINKEDNDFSRTGAEKAGEIPDESAAVIEDLQETPLALSSSLPAEEGGQASSSSGARLERIRHWSNDEYTRVVLDLDSPADYFHKLLKPDPELGTPHRLFIDLEQTRVSKDTHAEENVADGILRRIRSAQFSKDKSRVVLDIQDLDDFKVFALENPFRVVVDVFAPEKKRSLKAVSGESVPRVDLDSGNKDVTAQSLVEQLGLKVRTIMIDPGHGGKDPGAVYKNVLEKDIVLPMSKILGRMLEEKGFEVLYTRTTDVFVPLEERTAMANSKNVDLFISLHANAHRNRNVRGLEVYYLNFAQTKDAMRVAARENAVSTQKISDLQYILTDLMLSSKINESRDLANKIHKITFDHVRSRYSGIKDNGVRQAPFYVLMGARMPAILVETGYMTNEQDLKFLRSDDFLNQVAGGLTQGVLAYKDKIEQFARLE